MVTYLIHVLFAADINDPTLAQHSFIRSIQEEKNVSLPFHGRYEYAVVIIIYVDNMLM